MPCSEGRYRLAGGGATKGVARDKAPCPAPRIDAIGGVERPQNDRYVSFDSAQSDAERVSDLLVGLAGRNEPQHVELARRQVELANALRPAVRLRFRVTGKPKAARLDRSASEERDLYGCANDVGGRVVCDDRGRCGSAKATCCRHRRAESAHSTR